MGTYDQPMRTERLVTTDPSPASREHLAAAWELGEALGLPFIVRENGDLAIEPEALDTWWARSRRSVMRASDDHHPPTNTASQPSRGVTE